MLMALFLSACAPVSNDAEPARQALVAFFDSLNQGQYAEAAESYGGDYEVLIYHNPTLDPDDHAALWMNACTINGAQCLPVRTATLKEQFGDEYVFVVEFSNPDGTLFVLGPCCGGSETDFPPVSQFEYRVQKTADGKFVVLDLPVYVP
ncbi:MAG: hypothetical protein HUU11_18770 [Anaerolineales bacterium]|nr:hypothetical protein [Anaerolineales bacterium]